MPTGEELQVERQDCPLAQLMAPSYGSPQRALDNKDTSELSVCQGCHKGGLGSLRTPLLLAEAHILKQPRLQQQHTLLQGKRLEVALRRN